MEAFGILIYILKKQFLIHFENHFCMWAFKFFKQ